MLAGLLSGEACTLYEELVASGGLPADGLTYQESALAKLLSHGLVWESTGPPRQIRAVSQAVALRRLLGSRQRELAEARTRTSTGRTFPSAPRRTRTREAASTWESISSSTPTSGCRRVTRWRGTCSTSCPDHSMKIRIS
jgi:hypothetical protein